MSKKSFTIFVILLLAIIAFLGWFFFFRTQPGTTPNNTTPNTDLFPFDPTTSTSTTSNNTGTSTNVIDLTEGSNSKLPRLRQIWKEPTAGATFYPGTGTTTAVRFVDRATGHVYDSPIDATGESKVSNVTIPQIHEALWASNGTELVFRYLRNDSSIQSFYAMLATTSAATTSSSVEGYFLPAEIRDLEIAGDKILYFNPAVQIGSLIQARLDGTGKKAIMSSDARDWSLSYTNQKTAFLETRPSGLVKGFGYLLDLATGATTKVAGDIMGLTGTVNPSATWALMSAHEKGGFVTASYNIATKKTQTLSINTLSDKCSWSNVSSDIAYCATPVNPPSGTYPDDWYKGKTSFSDKLIAINLSTGTTTLLIDPSFDAAQEMDIIKITVSRNDSYLTFTNKKDMSQWLLRIEE